MTQNVTTKKHFLCPNCDYRLEEGPLDNLKESIPEWFYMATYEDQNLPWVSDFLFSLLSLLNKSSAQIKM